MCIVVDAMHSKHSHSGTCCSDQKAGPAWHYRQQTDTALGQYGKGRGGKAVTAHIERLGSDYSSVFFFLLLLISALPNSTCTEELQDKSQPSPERKPSQGPK